MGISAVLIEHFFEPEQRATGKYHGLLGVTQWQASIELQRTDDHHITIIIIAIGSRTTRDTGVSRLANNHAVRRHTGFEHVPKPHQRVGSKTAMAEPVPNRIPVVNRRIVCASIMIRVSTCAAAKSFIQLSVINFPLNVLVY